MATRANLPPTRLSSRFSRQQTILKSTRREAGPTTGGQHDSCLAALPHDGILKVLTRVQIGGWQVRCVELIKRGARNCHRLGAEAGWAGGKWGRLGGTDHLTVVSKGRNSSRKTPFDGF